MKRVVCFIRPHRVEQVKSAIAALGVTGLSVSDVRGRGNSPEETRWVGNQAHVVALPIRARIEVVVPTDAVESVIQQIVENAHTGEPGDGKIFVEPIVDALRVRTGERGEAAI